MNVLLLYPAFPDTFWSFKHALSFVRKRASSPPLGAITIAAMLPKEWRKRLVDVNVRKLRKADLNWADIVMVSAMVVQRESAQELIQRCKAHDLPVIAGGPLFTGEYEDFPEVDHFILNEGELTLPDFLADYARGEARRIYKSDEYADLSQTPTAMWELVDMSKYDSMGIQFSRGCPFNCDFCNITALLGHIPRVKSAKQIINELEAMYASGWRRNVFFVDDNFIGNKKILKEEILPALIEWRRDKKGFQFITEASINLADDDELMTLMAQAGFKSVFVGIETPDEGSLQECHKVQNRGRDLVSSVKILQNHGLQVMGGFIVGFDSDNNSIFDRQIEFIQQSGIVTAMVGLLQAPYGTQLYSRLLAEGRINVEMSGDNTDGSTNIVPKMDLTALKQGYQKILDTIYSAPMFYQRVKTFINSYKPLQNTVTIQAVEIYAFFRSVWKLGILSPDRKYYWDLLIWTLVHHPKQFGQAVTFTIYGYHFQKVMQKSGMSTA
ncbi:MAG: B12-binding domain-containing radical SAM protein [Anaerolineaceae bacterium]|nr:B12-binding domain-containing radical SAM protein [Anaerolineaceae bacterium]